MQHALVVDKDGKPLMPCTPGKARKLLDSGRASVWREYPFTIRRQDGASAQTQALRLKIDPGSKVTGLALVREDTGLVIWAAELTMRGLPIHLRMEDRASIRRSRRHRKTRYRPPRFNNRTRPKGWLAPSLQHRVLTTMTWVRRLCSLAPITCISYELVSFDTQLMETPDIAGVQYQQGTLAGYEVRQFLLEAYDYKCAYCGRENVPLEIEHIMPRSRGGSDRISNLTIACVSCNRKKGNQTAAEFGHPTIQQRVKVALRDVAVMNSTRWALWRALDTMGLPLECGTGGRTKWNRTRLSYPKEHWIDAACVGETGESVIVKPDHQPLRITAVGHGSRQICTTDAYGFPKQHRSRGRAPHGIQTGDVVLAVKPMHLKNGGKYRGRVSGARMKGGLDVRPQHSDLRVLSVNAKYCRVLHRADGYAYDFEPLS